VPARGPEAGCLGASYGERPELCEASLCGDAAYFRAHVELCFSAMLYSSLSRGRGGLVRIRPALVREVGRFREDGSVMRRVSNVLRELRAMLGGEYASREDAARAARRLFYKYLERG
jgi:hypothetical protein